MLVVGRAGIGLDNVDVEAATRRGVMVVNAPQSNIISAAEHTMALLLAQARNVPQAHAALTAGRWERRRWEGVELADKTLAVIGLGRIGKLVADRAKAFGMRVVAYDPFVSADKARQMGVELLSLDQAVAEADFLTIHLPKTKETTGLINRDLLLKAKPTMRVINVARGGIVDEAELGRGDPRRRHRRRRARRVRHRADHRVAAVRAWNRSSSRRTSGHRPARRRTRPATRSPTWCSWRSPASSCRSPSTSTPPRPTRRCDRSCRSPSGWAGCSPRWSPAGWPLPRQIEVCTEGDIAGYDTRILTLAASEGFFGSVTDEPVTYVNAPQLAKDHGVEVRETNCATSADFVNLITLRGGDRSLSGTLVGRRGEQRIVMIDDHSFDVPPADHMLMVKNDDRPGVIGIVGTLLGNAGVNIADMDVGAAADAGTAVMLIAPTGEVGDDVLAQLRVAPGSSRSTF